MKIAILTVQVPFITGGAEVHARSLGAELVERGHEVDIVTLPFKWYPPERVLDCMIMARLVDVEEVNGAKIDRVITLRFPAYFVAHPNKVGWILHQHRQAYELFGTEYGDLHQTETGRKVADEIRKWDARLLPDHRALYANSNTVRDRLQHYNQITAETLYHPPGNYERLHSADFGDFVLCPSRLDPMKRQHLIVDAMRHAPAGLTLALIGPSTGAYGARLRHTIEASGLAPRVRVLGMVSEEQKIDLYANCLAVYTGAYQEDYGYVTLEAFFAGKPVITHPDAGGPLEFVTDGMNGCVVAVDGQAIAGCLHRLYAERAHTRHLGACARQTIVDKHISWDHVIERLLV